MVDRIDGYPCAARYNVVHTTNVSGRTRITIDSINHPVTFASPDISTHWTDSEGITAHWIDADWKLQHTLLDFIEFESPHTGARMAELILRCLESYEIENKVFCITTDNASNNDTMATELYDLLYDRHDIVWDPATHHIYCLAHIINLVVRKLIDSLQSGDHTFKTTLAKIRKLAKAARHGSKKPASMRIACREANVTHLRIPFDVTVRWNSTYWMLEKAIYLREALDKFVGLHMDDLSEHRLSDQEWGVAEQLFMILMPFQRCTNRFESNSRSSEVDYVFFGYDVMFNHLEDVDATLQRSRSATASFLRTAISDALAVLRHYYNKTTTMPFLYADAMILNPRVKLCIFNTDSWSDEDPEFYKAGCRRRFTEEYCVAAHSAIQDDETTTTASTSSASNSGDGSGMDPEYEEHRRKRTKRSNVGESEFDVYMANPNPVPDVDDPFVWWKANETRFPNLSRMAKDHLAVPPSGCAVEREFSVSGRIATWQRNRLSAERIAAAMIYKSQLKREGLWQKAYEDEWVELIAWDDDDEMDIDEECGLDGVIPQEWSDTWWKTKVNQAGRR
jgi:hypothetical protein